MVPIFYNVQQRSFSNCCCQVLETVDLLQEVDTSTVVFETVTLLQEYQDSVIQDSGFSPPDAGNDKRLSQVANRTYRYASERSVQENDQDNYETSKVFTKSHRC
ncbi:uncharacterized protein LOC124144883 isoform X2 [Haliotis rufescens]|uniref:uncharacterized protein LOC124144883 isoform X2 n=1 Tax=Haliotis rufescens TaxID=6454 RepID=UPI00201F74F0|nr:uncharacterized protein LOC124144883 isoform X2 [Haliotis rufescens]